MRMIANEYIKFFIEFFKLFLLMCWVLRYRVKNVVRMIIDLLIALLFILMIHLIGLKIDYIFLSGILTIIVIIFNVEGKRKYFVSVASYFMISLADLVLSSVIIYQMQINAEELVQDNTLALLVNSINIVLLIVIWKISLKSFRDLRFFQKINRKYILLVIVGDTFIGIYLVLMQKIKFRPRYIESNSIIAFSINMIPILFILITTMLAFSNEDKKYYKDLYHINKKLLGCQKKYYSMLLEKENEKRKFHHDISHHMYCMHILLRDGKYNDLEEYFGNISKKLDRLKIGVKSGNDIVNAILIDILSDYKDNPIDIKWDGILPNSLQITNIDLCTIFSNLFQNATNAVAQLSKERYIKVDVKILETNLYVVIKNPVKEPIKIVKNKLISNKKNKWKHGYGSQNIAECMKRYNGVVNYKCINCMFVSELIIPNAIRV